MRVDLGMRLRRVNCTLRTYLTLIGMVIKLCDDGCCCTFTTSGWSVYVVLQWKQHAGEIYIYNPGAQHLLLAVYWLVLHLRVMKYAE